ncbi:MAG: sugar-transfer associated ATP-grasp domain-containing protein, partial [Coraliomargarita sp.]
YLLQVAVENHSSIAGFSLGPLVTFRVVTARYAEDPPVLIAGYCAIPRGQVQTNHEEYGGMVSKVNCETGRLEAAFSYTPYVEKHRQHPDTGAQIEGAQLDCWSEVVKLALAAHASFKDVLSIGWDIVYTPQGLYLLEGNTLWGLDPGLFLGRTEYVDICLNLWQDRHVSV